MAQYMCPMLPTRRAKSTEPCEKPEKTRVYLSPGAALHHLPRAEQKREGTEILKETI